MSQGDLIGKVILVVDDEDEVRAGIASGLERKGCSVLQASNGKDAFQLILSHSIDAVVTDLRMPNGTGIELLDWIKTKNVRVPVTFIMTGFSDVTEPELYDKGAEAIFQKPFQRKTLLAALERFLTPPDSRWAHAPEGMQTSAPIELNVTDLSEAVSKGLVGIGRGGLFLPTKGNLPSRGDLLPFLIRSGSGSVRLLEGKGVVRWTRSQAEQDHPRGCGIEFLELKADCRSNVVAWIESLKIRAFIPLK